MAACAFVPFAANGADLDVSETPPEQIDVRRFGGVQEKLHDWDVTLGGGAIYLPEYEGSGEFKVLPFPIFSASFRDTVHIDSTGVILDLYQQDGFRAGLKGGYELGRKEDDSDYLHGFGDVDPGAVIGGVISYERGPFEVYAELDKTVGGSDGLTARIGATVSHRYERFVFSGDVSATWADEKHMAAYFSIAPDQSARSGLPEYEAETGIKRVDLKASATYMLTDNWFVTGSAGTGVLIGDAKDSPIVRDEIQPFGMLGLGYRF
jgi:outer membrane protein